VTRATNLAGILLKRGAQNSSEKERGAKGTLLRRMKKEKRVNKKLNEVGGTIKGHQYKVKIIYRVGGAPFLLNKKKRIAAEPFEKIL